MTLTFGLMALALSSMPLMVATKNGLPSDPTEIPTFVRSFARGGARQPGKEGEAAGKSRDDHGFLRTTMRLIETDGGSTSLKPPPTWAVELDSGARRSLQAVAIERHRADDHEPLDDVLPDVGHADEDEPVRQDCDDQRADQRSPDRADAADEAGAAENDGGDRIEFVGLAKLQPVGRIEARRRHDAAEPGEQPRHAVDEQQHGPDLDAGEPRRVRVAADRVDVNAEHGPAQDEPGRPARTAARSATSQGTPNSVPLPMKANGSCGLNDRRVVRRAGAPMPRTAVSDPSVTMKGGRRAKAIRTPLTSPRPSPISKATGTPSMPQSGILDPRIATIAAAARIEPTDRSMPPVRITKVMPAASTVLIDACCATIDKF